MWVKVTYHCLRLLLSLCGGLFLCHKADVHIGPHHPVDDGDMAFSQAEERWKTQRAVNSFYVSGAYR